MANVTLFSQIISKLDRNIFKKIVKDKQSDKHQKGYNSWTHLVSMLFCSLQKGSLFGKLVMVYVRLLEI